jgi:hypothetical protein
VRWLPALALVAVFAVATWWGPTADTSISDFGLYRVNARALLDGLLPYRDFALEYPPGVLVPTLLPALVAGTTGDGYLIAFAVLMCGCLLVVQDRAARLAPGHERAAAWALALLPLAHGAIMRERFDLFAVALAIAGLQLVHAGARDRRAHLLGFALLGLGAATKLFPAVLAAAAVAWLWGAGARREAARAAAVAGTVLVAACAPFAALAPGGFFDQLRFHAERPLQIESLPATVLRLVGDPRVTGVPENPDRFRSQGVDGEGAGLAAALSLVVQLTAIALALAWAAAAGRRGDRQGLLLAGAAALIAFASLGKVLSPQYLLWLSPLIPGLWFAQARVAAVALAAAVVLTQLEFPARYTELVRGDPLALTLVSARDAALLAALVALAARGRRPPGRTPSAAAGTRR